MRFAAALGVCTILSACGLGGTTAATTPSAGTTSTPIQAASAPRITPPPVSPPTPPGTNLPAFKCADSSGGTAGSANLTGVRVTEYVGFDRFVLQFDSKVPSFTIKRQAKPVFKAGASGQPTTLNGVAGALVQVRSATGANTYTGSTDLSPAGFLVLNEARLIEDFEGSLSWGLGLNRSACLRTFTLSDPARLVIDFTTASR
jgi:hypothetical protein